MVPRGSSLAVVPDLKSRHWLWRNFTAVVRCCVRFWVWKGVRWPDFSSVVQKLHIFLNLFSNQWKTPWQVSVSDNCLVNLGEFNPFAFFPSYSFVTAMLLTEALKTFCIQNEQSSGEKPLVSHLRNLFRIYFFLRAQDTKLKVQSFQSVSLFPSCLRVVQAQMRIAPLISANS